MLTIEYIEDDLVMLRGVLACASVQGTKRYLQGIHITTARTEASDGARIGAFDTPGCSDPELNIVLPVFKIPPKSATVRISH